MAGHRHAAGGDVRAISGAAMKQEPSGVMSVGWCLRASGTLAVLVGSALWLALPEAQTGPQGPRYRVDPFWPKSLPIVTDSDGLSHQWVTGMVGASCIDSHDHIITVNRGFLRNGLLPQEGSQSIPSPPVMLYDPAGNVADSWGDATLTPEGAAAVLPHGIHAASPTIWTTSGSQVIQTASSKSGRMTGRGCCCRSGPRDSATAHRH